MDFTYPAVPADPGKYLTEEMPRFIASYVKLRDELALRQGALTAAEEAHALRNEAQTVLMQARLQADQMGKDTAAKLEAAKALKKELTEQDESLAAARAAWLTDTAAKAKQLDERERKLDTRAQQLEAQAETQALNAEALKVQQADLDAKVRALQAKVAALAL